MNMVKARKERTAGGDAALASIGLNVEDIEQTKAIGRYEVQCVGPVEEFRARYVFLRDRIQAIKNGGKFYRMLRQASLRRLLKEFAAIPLEPKWTEAFDNLVTTPGRNDMLDKYLAGSSYTAAWYILLIGSTSYTTGAAVTDTMASHGGWAEDVEYSQASPTNHLLVRGRRRQQSPFCSLCLLDQW